MTEFIIALIAFLVVIVAILQMGWFCRAKVQTMIWSRANAGRLAIQDEFVLTATPFVGTWSNGPDGVPYTEDDRMVGADATPFMNVATRATSEPFNYPFYSPFYVQNNHLAEFMDLNAGDYSTTRGWAIGIDYREVPIDPVFQKLVLSQRSLIISSRTVLPPFTTKSVP